MNYTENQQRILAYIKQEYELTQFEAEVIFGVWAKGIRTISPSSDGKRKYGKANKALAYITKNIK